MAFLEEVSWSGRNSVRLAIDGFSAASEALVYDALMHKPRSVFTGDPPDLALVTRLIVV